MPALEPAPLHIYFTHIESAIETLFMMLKLLFSFFIFFLKSPNMKDFYTDQVWPFKSCFALNQVHAVNFLDSWQVQLSVPEAEKCY